MGSVAHSREVALAVIRARPARPSAYDTPGLSTPSTNQRAAVLIRESTTLDQGRDQQEADAHRELNRQQRERGDLIDRSLADRGRHTPTRGCGDERPRGHSNQ